MSGRQPKTAIIRIYCHDAAVINISHKNPSFTRLKSSPAKRLPLPRLFPQE
ncbi:hypothetical protein HMPREF0201_00489 [Cedecea davisae DSM 4568]|uniref:Uncharacterized protein n=1 Tax=Cedecea davisae DSM 4568 TaxID=566551 RepID=S3K6Q0_9ENTR|nr:hypothetical protein HMPREF0201_00489 [Cedecea davisae DSM 4568]